MNVIPNGINVGMIKIGAGPTHNGAWHRAIYVAQQLQEAGIWNGQTQLIINDPYDLHRRLTRPNNEQPSDLKPGIDYVI